MKDFLPVFIPVFVAVDAIGVLPVFILLTRGMEWNQKRWVILQSLVTGFCLALGFIFLGQIVFRFLGITDHDFMVAGGAVLFCIALSDIMNPVKQRRMHGMDFGAVPLGTPLIVGPAVLTTSLNLSAEYGLGLTVASVVINILIAGMILRCADPIVRILGQGGTKAITKIVSLLLAAIAVRMIRKGLFPLVGG